MSTKLEINELIATYNKKVVLQNLTLTFTKPEIVSIIGPNGSGKSTLLKSMARLLKPHSGTVLLDERDIYQESPKQVARKIALLPQITLAPEDMTVEQLVTMGRNPYKPFFKNINDADIEIIYNAMRATDVFQYRHIPLYSLSGGERQRVWLALSLAQEPQILLLDEPTTYLDGYHQLALMKLIESTYKKRNISIIMVLHDLNLACKYSHRIIAIKNGTIVGDGPPSTLITEDAIAKWFGLRVDILWRQQKDISYPVCIPYEII